MRACDHQAQVPYWVVEIVAQNPYFEHAFEGPATMISAEAVAVPCEETRCAMQK